MYRLVPGSRRGLVEDAVVADEEDRVPGLGRGDGVESRQIEGVAGVERLVGDAADVRAVRLHLPDVPRLPAGSLTGEEDALAVERHVGIAGAGEVGRQIDESRRPAGAASAARPRRSRPAACRRRGPWQAAVSPAAGRRRPDARAVSRQRDPSPEAPEREARRQPLPGNRFNQVSFVDPQSAFLHSTAALPASPKRPGRKRDQPTKERNE